MHFAFWVRVRVEFGVEVRAKDKARVEVGVMESIHEEVSEFRDKAKLGPLQGLTRSF